MRRLLIGMLLLTICSCSLSLESAREKAINEFENHMFGLGINLELFSGPRLVSENENAYVFHWVSIVPRKGDTIVEILVRKSGSAVKGVRTKGVRNSNYFLIGTKYFPFNEAMLTMLFDLPPTPKVNDDETKRLRNVALNPRQLVDVANFVEIKRRLMNYHYDSKGNYPDDLNKLNLDSVYVYDQYGKEYIYMTFGKFVVLGSQGKNGKWDFENSAIDSVFSDQMKKYIMKNDDDILVKIRSIR